MCPTKNEFTKGLEFVYDALFNDLNQMRKLTQEKETFFDICGFPHYENVVSNVLAFFFNPSKEHGLGTLFIQALLKANGENIEGIDEFWEVEREVITSTGKFIDILLTHDERIILIENKIYASLYNDLDDYFYFVHKRFPKRQVHPMILCLNSPNEDIDLRGFTVITYEKFFKNIESLIGSTLQNADFKYLELLSDLMKNITKLKEGTKMDEEFLGILSKHQEEINDLLNHLNQYRDGLRKKVKEVITLLPDDVNSVKLKSWPYRTKDRLADTAVIDIILKEEMKMAIDTVIDQKGWRFEIFERGSSIASNDQFCVDKGLNGSLDHNRFVTSTRFPLNEDVSKVVEELIRTIGLLIGP